MEASVALSPVALAALKILIVDRNRDHECMVPCAFADVLHRRYMQNPDAWAPCAK